MEKEDMGRARRQADRATQASPQAPTGLGHPVSVPRAFEKTWQAEATVSAQYYGLPDADLVAGAYAWLEKICQWEASNLERILEAFEKEPQGRMGLCMALAAAFAASAMSARSDETQSGSVRQDASAAREAGDAHNA